MKIIKFIALAVGLTVVGLQSVEALNVIDVAKGVAAPFVLASYARDGLRSPVRSNTPAIITDNALAIASGLVAVVLLNHMLEQKNFSDLKDFSDLSKNEIKVGIEKAQRKWFSLMHARTWFMSDADYKVLCKQRAALVEIVRADSGDCFALNNALWSDFRGRGGKDDLIFEPLLIKHYDPIIKYLIAYAIKNGLDYMVSNLCVFARYSHDDLKKFVKCAKQAKEEKERIIKLEEECKIEMAKHVQELADVKAAVARVWHKFENGDLVREVTASGEPALAEMKAKYGELSTELGNAFTPAADLLRLAGNFGKEVIETTARHLGEERLKLKVDRLATAPVEMAITAQG